MHSTALALDFLLHICHLFGKDCHDNVFLKIS